ncbi:uncharacterized protein LOC109862360 [Pseudomyrmex gracilis]|uniref:uncharacterized protein LOC109862360 n=1 Tax=Pseudomyrmex gracilis TaxID=219809 RepID=UPI000995CC28|nr:uncharacterized protein LOC109862360 [Pseudomyrmex gracilis]
MIVVGRKTPWLIGVIAMLVFLASISLSESLGCVKSFRRDRFFRRSRMRIVDDDEERPVIAPVVIKMIEHPDKRNESGVLSFNCTDDSCTTEDEKLDLDISKLQDTLLPDEESLRYIVIPKKYEHFVSKKNTGSNRYKRDVKSNFTGTNSDTSKPLKNQSKIGRVPLYRSYTRIVRPSTSSSEVDRTKRSIDYYPSRARNASDYYAQRRAVMERYFARQREINARYANKTGSISSSNTTQLSFRHLDKNAAEKDATFRHPSMKIDLIYNGNESRNTIPNKLDNRRNSIPETDLGFKSDPSLSQARSSDNVERNALEYYVTPCPNISGTFAPKTRPPKNRTDDNSTDHVIWGTCEGKIVYQHNLLLSITGPSTVDTEFEVILESPLCITCVEVIRFNQTRANVTLNSGGRGKECAKLLLRGYENEGFYYIIKIWGVQKIDQNCSNVD